MTDSAAGLHGAPVSRDRIVDFCRRWKVSELCLFGSALRDDFRPDSDVDILISFGPGISCGFDDLLTMKEELETIFGRRVDLVERRLVEASENYIRRKHILSHLELLYSEPVRTAADAGGAGPD